ncbi:MAG: hypothetical protein LBT59_25260 [Clostridiales bacterium]|jgi:hypothetical protein|nr:hypothetical protein [Clostridiales bacterium]
MEDGKKPMEESKKPIEESKKPEETKITYKDFTVTLPTNVALVVEFLLQRSGLTPEKFFVSLCNRMYETRAILGSLDFVGKEENLSDEENSILDVVSVFSDAVNLVYDEATNSFSEERR